MPAPHPGNTLDLGEHLAEIGCRRGGLSERDESACRPERAYDRAMRQEKRSGRTRPKIAGEIKDHRRAGEDQRGRADGGKHGP